MKKSILILISFIMFSCSNNDKTEPIPFVPVTITSNLIAKRNDKGPTEGISQENIIINDTTNWEIFKNQMNSEYIAIGLGNYYTDNNFTETTIDFTNYTVVAVFDQAYTNRGHSIDIISIIEYETNIVVTIHKTTTVNGQNAASQPYHIVKIPKATKPIVFEEI